MYGTEEQVHKLRTIAEESEVYTLTEDEKRQDAEKAAKKAEKNKKKKEKAKAKKLEAK